MLSLSSRTIGGVDKVKEQSSIVETKPLLNKHLIKHFEKLLEEAKSGDLIAYAAALQYKGYVWDNTWALGEHKESSCTHLIGVLHTLSHKLCELKNELE